MTFSPKVFFVGSGGGVLEAPPILNKFLREPALLLAFLFEAVSLYDTPVSSSVNMLKPKDEAVPDFFISFLDYFFYYWPCLLLYFL